MMKIPAIATWNISAYSAFAFWLEKKIENVADMRELDSLLMVMTKIYDMIGELCRKEKIELVIANIGRPSAFIGEYCARTGTPFLDYGLNLDDSSIVVSKDDTHPNSKGNSLIAGKISDMIRKEYHTGQGVGGNLQQVK